MTTLEESLLKQQTKQTPSLESQFPLRPLHPEGALTSSDTNEIPGDFQDQVQQNTDQVTNGRSAKEETSMRREPTLDPHLPVETEALKPVSQEKGGQVFERLQKVAGQAWDSLSEGTKNFVGELYENIKNSDPVQNALDRTKAWGSDKLASFIEGRLAVAEARYTQAKTGLGESMARSEKALGDIEELQKTMRNLGMPKLSSKTLEEMQKQGRGFLQAEDEEQKNVEERKDKMEKVRRDFESLRATVGAYSERVNARLSAKQEAHAEEEVVLKGINAGLEDSVGKTREKMQKLESATSSFMETRRGLKGAAAKGYDEALKQIGENRGKLDSLLKEQLQDIASKKKRMMELQEKQARLEEKKLGKKKEAVPQSSPEPLPVNTEAVASIVQEGAATTSKKETSKNEAPYERVSLHQLLQDAYNRNNSKSQKTEAESQAPTGASEASGNAPVEAQTLASFEGGGSVPAVLTETEAREEKRSPLKLAKKFEEQIKKHVGKNFGLNPASLTLDISKAGVSMSSRGKDILMVTVKGADGNRYQFRGKLAEKDSKFARVNSKILT